MALCDTDRDGRDELVVGSPGFSPDLGTPTAGALHWTTDL